MVEWRKINPFSLKTTKDISELYLSFIDLLTNLFNVKRSINQHRNKIKNEKKVKDHLCYKTVLP